MIPIVERTIESIAGYLLWLNSNRKYSYHIDEHPNDIIFGDDVTDQEIENLGKNSDVMWDFANKNNVCLWKYYSAFPLSIGDVITFQGQDFDVVKLDTDINFGILVTLSSGQREYRDSINEFEISMVTYKK